MTSSDAIDALRALVADQESLVDAPTRFTVQAAPRNGRCMWYVLSRVVRRPSSHLLRLYASWLRLNPEAWETIRVVRELAPQPRAFVAALASGDEWGDESVLDVMSKRFSVCFLLLCLDDDDNLACHTFPHRGRFTYYAGLRFVGHHYDNIRINGKYVVHSSAVPPVVKLLWNLSNPQSTSTSTGGERTTAP